ncbi:MAG: hypothetical protein ABJD11_08835 [Gemmatimonadota bacterium]
MNRFQTAVATISVVLLTVPANAARPARQSDEWNVYLRRTGGIRFSMSVAQAARAGIRLTGAPGRGCGFARIISDPVGLRFMIEDGRIVRVDVDSTGIRTASGAEVGMTEEQIKAMYPGRITTQPHKYTGPEGHYLVYTPVDSADQNYRVIFETDGKVVTTFRAGIRPAVEYVEGCS